MSARSVVDVFELWIKSDPEQAVAVAAIQSLVHVLKSSSATTIKGLAAELRAASDQLKHTASASISLTAACELFNRYVSRALADIPDFDVCKARLVNRGELFASKSLESREKISAHGSQFIRDGSVILVHGYSRVSLGLLCRAARQGRQFSVLIAEGRPGTECHQVVERLKAHNVPCSIILDSAVARSMGEVDLVLVGAEGIVENGGVINKTGTYQIALLAKALSTPFYVAAESYKFARLFPLTQNDVPNLKSSFSKTEPILQSGNDCQITHWSHDYTPPEFITLLFTDLGILTPSAVSDELIKLYF